jgi:N-terminal acetyltransferase B complex non-catalytic subunit
MVHVNNYSGIQKSTMALHKHGKRKYTLWAIFGFYMALKSGSTSKAEKMIFPQLAARLLEGLKPLQNAQEGYLQALIYQVSNKKKELAEFLKSEQVMTWDLLDLNVLIPRALEEVEDWEGLQTHCIDYLVEKKRDDWNHWKALLTSFERLNTPAKAIEFITSYKKSQNSLLAMVEAASRGISGALPINEATENYFNFMCKKRSTFPDLIKYVSLKNFDQAKWLAFLDKVDCNDQIVKANVEKFKFLYREDNLDVDAFVKTQIKNYEQYQVQLKMKDVKDYHPADDFLLLSALAILEKSQDKVSLEKAAVLLELAALNDKYQFYVRLWLVRIYLRLGAFNLAKGHYKILKVSKIQHESLSHFMLTRLTSIFPDFEVLYDAFEQYESANDEITSYLLQAFEKGSYTQLESMNDLQRIMKSSVSRGIVHVEIRKTKQFQTIPKLEALTTLKIDGMADSRDFDIMFDIPRPGQECLSQLPGLTLGPKLGKKWVNAHQIKYDILKSLVKGTEDLKIECEALKQAITDSDDEVTEIEKWSLQVVHLLSVSALDKKKDQHYSTLLKKLTEAEPIVARAGSQSELQGQFAWPQLHVLYTVLETAKIVADYAELLSKHKSSIQFNTAAVAALKSKLETGLYVQVREAAAAIKTKRDATVQSELDAVVNWSEKLGFTGVFRNNIKHIVESVIEDVAVNQDQTLTYIRSIKL